MARLNAWAIMLAICCAMCWGSFEVGALRERRRCAEGAAEREVLVAERDRAIQIGRECVAELDFALGRWGETLSLLGWKPEPQPLRPVAEVN